MLNDELKGLSQKCNPDVIVVGAGPCGLTATKVCLERGLHVLLIDSGTGSTYPYSSIEIKDNRVPQSNLGGIGGTARIWHGQIVRMPEEFEFFNNSKSWDYSRYLAESQSIEKLFGVNFGNVILSKASKIDNQKPKFEELPVKIVRTFVARNSTNWEKLFRRELRNRKCDYYEDKVKFLTIQKDKVVEIQCESGTKIKVEPKMLVILAANSLANNLILRESQFADGNKNPFRGLLTTAFDHPYKVMATLEANSANAILNGSVFYRPIKSHFRIKVRRKFVVSHKNREIGLFELRPQFGYRYGTNRILRLVNNIWILCFRKNLFRVKRFDLWIQIEMKKPTEFTFSDSIVLEASGEAKNVGNDERFRIVFGVARDYLNSLFSEDPSFRLMEFDSDPIGAHHPSGTVEAGYDRKRFSFNFEGESLDYSNLLLTGGALVSSGSWVNPTLSLMAFAQGNVRSKIKKCFG